ncbi:hypothetical protein ACHQM5_019021 [Ranunculus cassubicifolius]
MSKWDKIFSLPVQSPPTYEFSAADLEWSTVEGYGDILEKVAFIPFDRVNNFISGESANKNFPTKFSRTTTRQGCISKAKVDGVIEYTVYYCSFGPDDRRKDGILRPSRINYVIKKKSAGRPSIKRGCQCHFHVKRLVARPSAALLIYKQDKHVDKNGLHCHGPEHARAVGLQAIFAPSISDDHHLLLSLIHIGFSVETIMHIRNELVKKQEGTFNRDDVALHRFIRRLERSVRRSNYALDDDDAVSIEFWADKHKSDIFFRQDYSNSEPFILGIQTEWQLEQMMKFGKNSLMASDSRFGSNKLKNPVQSLLVFDSDKNAIPVAWIIAPKSSTYKDAYKWIRDLHQKVHSKDSTWKLAGFIVDDPLADVSTIREVFQCPVLISLWRVRHAWQINLMKKCSGVELRSEMFGQLGQAIYNICQDNGDMDLFENFMEDFIDCSDFVDYFRASWLPRIGTWIAPLKSLPYTSQETCSAIECYHHRLKQMLINEKDTSVFQRTDWLVNKLYTNVHSWFFFDDYTGKDDFAQYMRKVKWIKRSSPWQKALEIPDSDIVLENGKSVKVISQHSREKVHTVRNIGSEFATCDCKWAELGNLCKHVIKASCMYGRNKESRQSLSLFKYNRSLLSLLHFPTKDSLVRDHAVCLAVCAQKQVSSLLN